MLVLLPMLAFAGWKQVTAAGSVQDVQVIDAGRQTRPRPVEVRGGVACVWPVSAEGRP